MMVQNVAKPVEIAFAGLPYLIRSTEQSIVGSELRLKHRLLDTPLPIAFLPKLEAELKYLERVLCVCMNNGSLGSRKAPLLDECC